MVQQTKDSTFNEYGLVHAESGLPNSEKQMSVPVAARKAVLQNSQNEIAMVLPKPIESPLRAKDSEPTGEVAENSGTKRPISECEESPPQNQNTKSNSGHGHLVYVRRKTEAESVKGNSSDKQMDAIGASHSKESSEKGEITCQDTLIKEPTTSISNVSSTKSPSSPGISSAKPSVSPPQKSDTPPESAPQVYAFPKQVNVMHWEERYRRLQNTLKMLDRSDDYDYIQMLWSLSSVELSRHAVELEKRSIQLSLEEAKELQRVRELDVLGKYTRYLTTSSTNKGQLQK